MKITVKTLQQKVFYVEADLADTISVLKEKIENEQGHAVSSQKIIYSGKVLADDKTIESCQIKEKDFLVLMVSKPKPPPAASTSTSTVTPVAAPPPPDTAAPVPPASAPAPTPDTQAPVSSDPSAPAPSIDPAQPAAEAPALGASFLSGPALQGTISNMVEMGFPRDQVMRALRASYNNPDRAVEYLFNGIPTHLAEPESAPAPQRAPPNAPPNLPVTSPAVAPPVAAQAQPPAPSGPQNLFQLAQQQQQHPPQAPQSVGGPGGHPRVDPRILGALAQNPEALHPLIQQIAQSNPQLAALAAAHPEQLLNLLSGGEDDDGESVPPGATVVHVTPEEQAAIERLEALGFTREDAAEAYFACDKNEELAANLLFSRFD